ncbi:hypothetical protein [Streptomyces sp. NPDC060184]|uniref:hypothetical protein n=1 Tax=Streptomyces sp. NPDC060184 TaxID=3347064 RepID=UPI003663E90C
MALRHGHRKRFAHPALGPIEVDCFSLFSEDGRQRLLWFAPAVGTDSVGVLSLLASVGTRELADPAR